MIKTCKWCIFFTPRFGYTDNYKNGKRGDCEKIIEEYGTTIKETDAIIFGVGGHYDSVEVGEDFGCIHFKNKD